MNTSVTIPNTNTPIASAVVGPKRLLFRLLKPVVFVALICSLGYAGYVTQARWKPLLFPVAPAEESDDHAEDAPLSEQILLSTQAQKNLKLITKPLKAESYWKTISVPGIVVDRPGFSDRGVVTPATGIVTKIHRVAGDNVKPGDLLFTVKLLSESLQLSQSDLFKSTEELKLYQDQKKRLAQAGNAVSESKLIEVENQITRFQVAIKAYRQELLNRGLSAEQINGVAEGIFVSEIPIVAPNRAALAPPLATTLVTIPTFEIQDIKVELGQQVLAGQTLSLLSNHQYLSVEGQAFRDETPLLERAVKEGWPVDVDFREGDNIDWPQHSTELPIHYLSNTIDPETRTFRFLLPLENQSHTVEREGRSQLLWRYRPGQRVRLLVRSEKIDNVFVVPASAVAREGANAYVFRQNGDTFDRKPVQVVWQDTERVILANDGSVPPGIYIAHTGATQLNRMVKSQSGTAPAGFHVHADGSVHAGKH